MSREVVLKPIDATPEQIAQALFRKSRRKPEPRQMSLDLNEENLNTDESKDKDQ